jgi:hypothetical protein
LEELMMTKKIALLLTVGAALGLSLASADEAQAFGRRNGSHGSWGSNGSSGGSFGGLFSRRSHGSCGGSYSDCNNGCCGESNGSCGSHGGTYTPSGEATGTGQTGAGGPPPAPRDPGAGASASNGTPTEVNGQPVAAADRQEPVTFVSNRRYRFFR